jgi:hypothetical protein
VLVLRYSSLSSWPLTASNLAVSGFLRLLVFDSRLGRASVILISGNHRTLGFGWPSISINFFISDFYRSPIFGNFRRLVFCWPFTSGNPRVLVLCWHQISSNLIDMVSVDPLSPAIALWCVCVDLIFSYPHSSNFTSPVVNGSRWFCEFLLDNRYLYNYHNSGRYPSSCPLFKTQHFEDWLMFLSSGGTYWGGPNRKADFCVRIPATNVVKNQDDG